MSILKHLFSNEADPRAALRPLWHRLIEIAREPHWYAELGVADTTEGRFDMVTLVTSLAIIRMGEDEALIPQSALLTELYVEDMEGQLRESGVGDPVISKHMGRLMSSLGGRIQALREGLSDDSSDAFEAVVSRNVTTNERANFAPLAGAVRTLHEILSTTNGDALLEGHITR